MNRKGEVEIAINTRWLERAFFLLLIAVLAGALIWQYTKETGETDATNLEEVAKLQTELAAKEDEASALRIRVASLEAELEEASALPAPTPAPVATPPPAATSGFLNAAWDYEGTFSKDSFRLGSVTIYGTNTFDTSKSLSYKLCWSLLDCENVVTEGSFTVSANDDVTHEVSLTIPRTVDVSSPQKLKLVVTSGSQTILSEEKIIK